MPAFARFVVIDYSGAETPTASLKGLRVYMADGEAPPVEVPPPPSPKKYWTRRGVAAWLVKRLAEDVPTLVGIDHGKDPSRNPSTRAFPGCDLSESALDGASISGHSTARTCRRSDRRSPRSIRHCGAKSSPMRAARATNITPLALRRGSTWTTSLAALLKPKLTPPEHAVAQVGGWISGVA